MLRHLTRSFVRAGPHLGQALPTNDTLTPAMDRREKVTTSPPEEMTMRPIAGESSGLAELNAIKVRHNHTGARQGLAPHSEGRTRRTRHSTRNQLGRQVQSREYAPSRRLVGARMARISMQGSALFVSADSPYDREMIFEHADLYARRHKKVHLELDQRAWVIRAGADQTAGLCAGCHRHIEGATYAILTRILCLRCAKKLAH